MFNIKIFSKMWESKNIFTGCCEDNNTGSMPREGNPELARTTEKANF